MQRRCDRNRKRSKRRAIVCPIHNCHLDSVSQKYPLYADTVERLREKGISRKSAQMMMYDRAAVPLQGEWLEAFWCQECQQTNWYKVCKCARAYSISLAPRQLWQQATGAIDPRGNPSVGEFTRRHSRMAKGQGIRTYAYLK